MSKPLMPDFPVVDFHVHLPLPNPKGKKSDSSNKIIIDYRQKLQHKFREKWGFPKPENKTYTPDEAIQRWKKEQEFYNLTLINLVTGRDNETLANCISKYPDNFVGFTHHNIQETDGLTKLKYGVEQLGLVGHKILAPYMDIAFHDPSLEPIWKYLASKSLPVIIHFGMAGGQGGLANYQLINPLSIFTVARNYPEIPFIIPHFGAGYIREVFQLAWSLPNIYIDTSGSNQWIEWLPYNIDLKDIFHQTLKTMGPERLIFGTDSSWFPRGFSYPYLKQQWEILIDIGVSKADQELIFYKNALRLLQKQQ